MTTENSEQLNRLAIPDVLRFEVVGKGLTKGIVSSAACDAEFFLHGAHVTKWHPRHAAEPVLYLSERTFYDPEKAIRGGVPIIFPWFGSRSPEVSGGTTEGPAHGFARTALWTLSSAQMKNDRLELVLTFDSSQRHSSADTTPSASTSLETQPPNTFGITNCRLEYRVSFGKTLELELQVHNLSPATPLRFEEALHTYLYVGDATRITLSGLQGVDYIDKTDDFKKKHQDEKLLSLHKIVDSPYVNFQGSVVVHDPVFQRELLIAKENSNSTVIWNPWTELASKLSDMAPDDWKNMVCVETANVSDNLIELRPNQSHKMRTEISTR